MTKLPSKRQWLKLTALGYACFFTLVVIVTLTAVSIVDELSPPVSILLLGLLGLYTLDVLVLYYFDVYQMSREAANKPSDSETRTRGKPARHIRISNRYLVPLLCAIAIVARIVWDDIRFDQTALWLFLIGVIVILIPDIGDLVSRIKKFKKGDIEIEFESLVAKLARNTEIVEERTQAETKGEYLVDFEPSELRNRVAELTRDPRGGLVGLAVEIEAAIALLAAKHGLRERGQRIPPLRAVNELSRRGVLPKELPGLFSDFWTIRNQAVHSIDFQPSNQSLYEILDLGIRILRLLSIETSDQ